MSDYQMLRTYLEVVFGDVVDRARHDERGVTAEAIVIMGAACSAPPRWPSILWAKLKGGAESVNVPAPAAP